MTSTHTLSDTITAIATIGQCAPSPDNSQPWHFTWDGENLATRYDTQRVGGKTFPPTSPAALISMGATIENFSLLSTSCDTNLEVQLSPEDQVMANFTFSDIHAIGDLDKLLSDSPMVKRHTNRHPYQKDSIPHPVIDKLSGLSEGTARIALFCSSEQKKTVAELVVDASRVRFQTREAHEWLASSLRFSAEEIAAGDGLDVQTLALPPGGIQFMKFIRDWRRMSILNRLGAYRLLAKTDAGPLTLAPAIVAICAPATQTGAIEAGRLMTRAWTYLNQQELAVHPYYVISDQLSRFAEGGVPGQLTAQVEQLKSLSEAFFVLQGEETLHMLLRIGYPTREAVRSRRLPVDRVFTDLTGDTPKTC